MTESDNPWKRMLQKVEVKKPTTPSAWPGRVSTKVYDFEKPEIRARIVEMVEEGYPMKDCAAACGVTRQTFHNWREKALAGEEPFASFFVELDQASANGKVGLLEDIRKAGRGAPDHNGIHKNDWKASAFLLKTQWPEDFTETKKIEVKSTMEHRPFVDPRNLSEEELDQLAALLEKGQNGAYSDLANTESRTPLLVSSVEIVGE